MIKTALKEIFSECVDGGSTIGYKYKSLTIAELLLKFFDFMTVYYIVEDGTVL